MAGTVPIRVSVDRPDQPKARLLSHEPGLDGIRGLAVVAVIAHHLRPHSLPGGFLGVDLFFVLSGYLITSLLVSELRLQGTVDLSAFWSRRARRLLPALYLLLVGLAFAAPLLPTWQRQSVRGDGIAALFYVSNWRFAASGEPYFQSSGAPSPLLHLWSLAIEEQTYLLWPLLVLAIWRFGGRRASAVGWAAFGLAAASAVAMVLTPPNDTSYFASHTRIQAIMIGAVAAVAVPMGRRPVLRPRDANCGDEPSEDSDDAMTSRAGWAGRRRLGIGRGAGAASQEFWPVATWLRPVGGGLAALVLLVMAVAVEGTDTWMYRGGFTLAALASTGLVLSASGPGPVGLVAGLRPLRALGRVSYGLYLFHWPVIVFCTEGRIGFGGWRLDALRLLLMGGLTLLSYRLVEQPVRRGTLSTAATRWVTPVAVGLASIAVVAVGIGAAPPPSYLRQTDATEVGGAAATSIAPPVGSGGVGGPAESGPDPTLGSGSIGGSMPTVLTAPPQVRSITLVGDSVMASLAPGLVDAAAHRGIQVIDRAAPGCGVVTNSEPAFPDGSPIGFTKGCRAAIGDIQEAAASDRSDLVVVLSTWEAGDRLEAGRHLRPQSAAWATSVQAGLQEMVDRLGPSGSRIVFLGSAPIVPGLVRTIDAATRRGNRSLVELEEHFAATDPALGWVDLGPIVCDGNEATCPTVVEGVRRRPDDGAHFSPAGAQSIGSAVLDAILMV